MRYRGLVEACSRIYVDGVLHLVRRPRRLAWNGARGLVLSSRREKKAAIGSECQAPEERGEGFVVVHVGVPYRKTHRSIETW